MLLLQPKAANLPNSRWTGFHIRKQAGRYLCCMEWTYTLPEIDETARVFWKSFPDKKIYAFGGEMGTGKTSFIRALCMAKKVKESVGSPTFSIINEYSYPDGIIYHLDLYRLKDEEEAIRAGVEDCLYSGEICLVEWPARAPGIFPDNTLGIFLQIIDANTRKIRVPSVIGKNSG
jgi:tRNA threonylcarbamoyladenosine biosynthesis protein TsaE